MLVTMLICHMLVHERRPQFAIVCIWILRLCAMLDPTREFLLFKRNQVLLRYLGPLEYAVRSAQGATMPKSLLRGLPMYAAPLTPDFRAAAADRTSNAWRGLPGGEVQAGAWTQWTSSVTASWMGQTLMANRSEGGAAQPAATVAAHAAVVGDTWRAWIEGLAADNRTRVDSI